MRSKLDKSRKLVVQLLLLTFVLRTLIPVGFMPDFRAATEGVFKIVICSASGSKTILVDDTSIQYSGHTTPDSNLGKHDQPCAFASLLAGALPALDSGLPVSYALVTETIVPNLAVVLPPTRAGPLLGSRGPPQVS